MASTTLGLKVDETLRARLRAAADKLGRTPHWFIKQAVLSYLDQVEQGRLPAELAHLAGEEVQPEDAPARDGAPQPFLEFAQSVAPQSVLRAAITAAYRRPEPECVPLLIGQARTQHGEKIQALAAKLVRTLREKRRAGGVEGLIQEFSLSSQEGVALMCLAEALLRIPDRATRDALIRDKISRGDWQSHVGQSPSLFVNAAAWGLVLTGKLVATNSEQSLSRALTRLIGKGGEPLIRKGVDIAMRMMGEQFVTGETISEALANSRRYEAKGFRYSYDMLGEAATTEEDARRYFDSYVQAIHAIGKASNGRGIYEGPGISIKLSALHPRYSRAQYERVMGELLPRLRELAHLARSYDIGLNIDAEEADRLEISLDLLEALCLDPALEGWNGIGFVVQAYQKRAPYVIDFIIDLARRSRHRIMVRLVKGAYWDSEIKRAQVDGLEGYPVYTRKVYTDVSYLACARKLLAAPEAVFPQFATHNAHTLASIYYMAGQNYYPGQYEFQCLHGMGESLYEEVTGPVSQGKLNRPCRIYAPVGTHETLLAYLVRRLLENGANTSFVNLIGDPDVKVEDLVADPVERASRIVPLGAPHERIPLPRELYQAAGEPRANSIGLDLSNEHRLASLSSALLAGTATPWRAEPMLDEPDVQRDAARARPVCNPADHRDVVGYVIEADERDVETALAAAVRAAPIWQATPVSERAQCLQRAARLLEEQMQPLLGLIVREAGKSLPNAVAEVREAVDFLRYYAAEAEQRFAPLALPGPTGESNELRLRGRGVFVCISPWNFPLAIFTGQVAAALVAGNSVAAKPAEQTPAVAQRMVALLHGCGVPEDALQLLHGPGETVGAALVRDARCAGVAFTGSTEVAKAIQRSLADKDGPIVPLIAETGGINAMLVDSTALPEQVVDAVIQSAFRSAGQRCSALRLLCLHVHIADAVLQMLAGAMQELVVGDPLQRSTDVGPVIDAQAHAALARHVARLDAQARLVARTPLPAGLAGDHLAPVAYEVRDIAEVREEVFGPVLHVVRWGSGELATPEAVIDRVNALGYGLTLGVQTRIEGRALQVAQRARVGNVYVNRNMIGAVVGVQPFGGEGLSGTGPKAGGPHYLLRFASEQTLTINTAAAGGNAALLAGGR